MIILILQYLDCIHIINAEMFVYLLCLYYQ